jgi:hypothetical protein
VSFRSVLKLTRMSDSPRPTSTEDSAPGSSSLQSSSSSSLSSLEQQGPPSTPETPITVGLSDILKWKEELSAVRVSWITSSDRV